MQRQTLNMIALMLFVLLVQVLAASDTQVVYNPFAYQLTTITIKAENPTATTFVNVCPSNTTTAAASTTFTSLQLTPPQQPGVFLSTWKVTSCMPLTITQGPSTWAYSNSDSLGNVYATCSFSGGPLPQGSGACTLSVGGLLTEVFTSTDSWEGAMSTLTGYDTVRVVTATEAPSSRQATPSTQGPTAVSSSDSHASSTTGGARAVAAPAGFLLFALGVVFQAI